MAALKVSVRYATGWPTALMHFEAPTNSGSSDGWTSQEMQVCLNFLLNLYSL